MKRQIPRTQIRWYHVVALAFALCSTVGGARFGTPVDVLAYAEGRSVIRSSGTGQDRMAVDRLLRISDDDRAIVDLFRLGSDVVPELVRALRTRELRARAARAIAYSGDAAGLKTLLSTVRSERDPAIRTELAYLAGSLVQVRGPEYLKFLADCMELYREDEADVLAAAAALTLGTMRTAEASRILRVARELDEEELAHHEIAKAQRWIDSRRAVTGYRRPDQTATEDGRLKEFVLTNAFYAEGEEASLAVETVIWNQRRDKALVEVAVYEKSTLAREYHVVVEPVVGKVGEFLITGIWLNLVA